MISIKKDPEENRGEPSDSPRSKKKPLEKKKCVDCKRN